MRMQTIMSRQRGAALVIVLLMVATVSFVALAISERTMLAADRAVNARARHELLWRAQGVESLAAAAIEAAVEASPAMTADSPLFSGPLDVPMDGGGAVLVFRDRTRCFNLNSLVAGDGAAERNESAVDELRILVTALGLGEAEADAVADSVIDWIDPDSFQESRGGEDGLYSGLPTPYRTGSAPLADVTEVRAMTGVPREVFVQLRPRLCALRSGDVRVNVNFLAADDAPLLAALTGGVISVQEARDIIADRPPGGYGEPQEIWSHPIFEGKEEVSEARRARVSGDSELIEAYAVINYEQAENNVSMLFEVKDGDASLVNRRYERFQ